MTDVFASEVEFELTADARLVPALLCFPCKRRLSVHLHCRYDEGIMLPRGWLRLFDDAQHALFKPFVLELASHLSHIQPAAFSTCCRASANSDPGAACNALY